MNMDYEKQAEKILSLGSNWKNRDEKFKEMTIQIMVNSLRYMKNNKDFKDEKINDRFKINFIF